MVSVILQLSHPGERTEEIVPQKYSDLPLIPEIQSALSSLEYTIPTPIQSGAIPPLLEGKDFLGCAQTGTGKTAAFAIPILQKLHLAGKNPLAKHPVGLIVAPTRELVVQISENIAAIGKHTKVRHTTIYGGVGQRPQVAALAKGVHLVVATPGRLLDLIDQDYCSLSRLQYFVLDEADRMLDMGFMPDVQKIVRLLPQRRQSVFLSATMPPPIEKLAAALLHNHVTVMVTPPAKTADRVKQSLMYVEKSDKRKLLDKLLADESRSRILVFMRTKHGADRLYKSLIQAGVSAEGIHGGRSQNARQRVLNMFRDGTVRVLIATDVAARGIDIDNIDLVINYDVPVEADAYVHRIGRTARAGASGESITFCDSEEYKHIQEIEKTIGMPIPVYRDHSYHSSNAEDHELRTYANKEKNRGFRGGNRQSQAGPSRKHKGSVSTSRSVERGPSSADSKVGSKTLHNANRKSIKKKKGPPRTGNTGSANPRSGNTLSGNPGSGNASKSFGRRARGNSKRR